MRSRNSAATALVAILLAACGGGGGGSFSPLPLWMATAVKVADVDGDGRADVVAIAPVLQASNAPEEGWMFVWRQTSAGSFSAPQKYRVGFTPWSLAITDVDGDGAPDVVVSDVGGDRPGGTSGAWLLRQDPANRGTFLPAQQLVQTERQPYNVAVGDVNGDGVPDIVLDAPVAGMSGATLLTQDPHRRGTFLAPVTLALPGIYAANVAIGDLDGDGRNDLVFRVGTSVTLGNAVTALGVLHGLPDGTLGPWFELPSPAQGLNSQSLAIVDANADGKADILEYLTTCCGDTYSRVAALWQGPGGSFTQTTSSLAGIRGIEGSAFADLDADGRTDFALAGSYPVGSSPLAGPTIESRFNVLRQDATGVMRLTQGTTLPFAEVIAAGDVNGDGLADLVVFDFQDDGPALLVLLQSAASHGDFALAQTVK